MIPRYSRLEMAAIWSSAEKYKIWFQIEASASEAMANWARLPKRTRRQSKASI